MTSKSCYHCGDEIIGKPILDGDKEFCCSGCRNVFKILEDNQLGSFYELDEKPGVRPVDANDHKYAFLDIESIKEKFIDFQDDNVIHTTLFLPQIHCSSCIYLLENLHKINPLVKGCQVNFTKRQASIIFDKQLAFSELAFLLNKIGYPPNFNQQKEPSKTQNKNYLYKLGVAGFAFGSIMLWSFPEYLGIENDNPEFRTFTSYLSLAVSIPVILYSANEYLISAYKALKHRYLNLDVPITIGILALYIKSAYTIVSGGGPGYMDSFAGFVFFLLIGRWFQSKSFQSLSFDRDYTSYFPVAVTRKKGNEEEIVAIDEVESEDTIILRNLEIIPCDVILMDDEVKIDYSFITGESIPISKTKGELIYAGGKLLGKKSLFKVKNKSDRSHLTQLWNDDNSAEQEKASDKLSIYFLAGVLIIATAAAFFWGWKDSSRITEIVVSVLIVACPCAIALSKPFTYGNIMRILGKRGLYLKNVGVIERLNEVDTLVLDKTGTMTTGSNEKIEYVGEPLNQDYIDAIRIVANSSTHPLSRSLVAYLKDKCVNQDITLSEFEETSGKGISGIVNGVHYKIGSAKFVQGEQSETTAETSSHISIDGRYFGRFIYESKFRNGVFAMLKKLFGHLSIYILSGDKDKDKEEILEHLPGLDSLQFDQSPQDKLNFIQSLKEQQKHVLMIGDGLNDSGALDVADIGIAVSEDIFHFTPSSDAIIEASKLNQLDALMDISRRARKVLIICYVFSIIYNIVGLGFALTGNLSPLIAAILMPLSSISIVILSTLFSRVNI